MRKAFLYTILLLVGTFIGCSHQSVTSRLAVIDSLVVKEQFESAYHLLKSINENQLDDREDRAHYQLLKFRTYYVARKPLPPDNVLDSALTYYQENKNAEKLADCYYYKASMFYKKGGYQKAVYYLKKAEEEAEQSEKYYLLFKISEAISIINNAEGNNKMALYYAKKALNYSVTSKRNDWIAYSYFIMGEAYFELGREDSALYYFNKIAPYTKYVREEDKPFFLSNLSLVYIDNNPEKSKKLLLEALSYKELTSALEQLASISYDEGNIAEAYCLWKKALTINDLTPKDNIIHNILEYDIEHGRTDQVCDRVNEIIAIKDSIIDKLKNDTIKDLQVRFDHEVSLNAAHEKLIQWQWYLGLAVGVCLILTILWLIKRNKMKRMLNEREIEIQNLIIQVNGKKVEMDNVDKLIAQSTSEDVNDTTQMSQQLLELKRQKEDAERECLKLNEKIKNWAGEEAEKVREGALLINEVKENKSLRHWPEEQQKSLIAYYFAVNTGLAKEARKKYKKLSTKEILYLILEDMKKERSEMSTIMGVDENTLRSYKFRIKQKKM